MKLDEKNSGIVLASAMICGRPRKVAGRIILSAYDGVWYAVDDLPRELLPFVTDDIGNEFVSYGGFLQILDKKLFEFLARYELFACFRGIEAALVDGLHLSPPTEFYDGIANELHFIGWDIFTGNGWRSASCDGLFPVDPFLGFDCCGKFPLIQANEFGLISDLEDCMIYCKANDIEVKEWAPWNPVAVYIDNSSWVRLRSLSDNE